MTVANHMMIVASKAYIDFAFVVQQFHHIFAIDNLGNIPCPGGRRGLFLALQRGRYDLFHADQSLQEVGGSFVMVSGEHLNPVVALFSLDSMGS